MLDPSIFGEPPPEKRCRIEGCDHPRQHHRTLCAGHFRQQIDRRPFAPLRPYRRRNSASRPLCEIAGCDRRMKQAGLCPAHYQRKLRGKLDDPRPIQPHRPKSSTRDVYARLTVDAADTIKRQAKAMGRSTSQLAAYVLEQWARDVTARKREGM